MNNLEWHVEEDGESISTGRPPTPPNRNNRRTAVVTLSLALIVAAAVTRLTASPTSPPDQASPVPTSAAVDELLMADLMTLQAPAQSEDMSSAAPVGTETPGPDMTSVASAPEEATTGLPLPENLPTSTPLLPESLPASTPLVPPPPPAQPPPSQESPFPSPGLGGVATPTGTLAGSQTPGAELTGTPTATPGVPTATEVPAGPYPAGSETPTGPYP